MKRHPILPPQTYSEGDDEAIEAGARVTPLAPPPEWLRQFADGNYAALRSEPLGDHVEAQFWNGSPRYSMMVSRSVPAQRGSGRAILAACLWMIFALLGIEAIRGLMG